MPHQIYANIAYMIPRTTHDTPIITNLIALKTWPLTTKLLNQSKKTFNMFHIEILHTSSVHS
jgi:hypothetical protein